MSIPTDFFTKVAKIRPALNIGCLFDIPTGAYHLGKHGESILSGGLAHFTGVGGKGNTYKTTVMHFFNLSAMNRYGDPHDLMGNPSPYLIYDSENSMNPTRVEHLADQYDFLAGLGLDELNRVIITDTTMSGNSYFDMLKKYGKDKLTQKGVWITTPFLNDKGENIKIITPTFVGIDSLSMMPIDSVDAIYDKHGIGESGLNVEAMKTAAAKSQMMMQMPKVTSSCGLYVTATAHLGNEIVMDQYAPSKKQLTFLKQDTKFKRVPENYSFLTNILWCCLSANVLQNKSDKTPLYPKDGGDRMEGDVDLQLITIQALRSKGGATGLPFELVASQRDGLLVGLSEFHYIKTRKYGLNGNDRSYALDIYPDVSLQRTTVRGIIDNDAKLRRALEITSELCQISILWKGLDDVMCTPEVLYKDIKALGGDWDTILSETRGYWQPTEIEKKNPLKFLSTMDLLNWRAGKYTPYWLKKK